MSTRLIGALVMTHGDDRGLFLPPKVAPVQAVIVPILFGKNDDMVLDKCREALSTLEGLRVKLDDDPNQTAGWKFNQYEMLGVPVRIEIGPKDVQKEQAVLVPRDRSGKRFVKFESLKDEVGNLLDEVQAGMLKAARARVGDMTQQATTIQEFKQKLAAKPGYILVHWCGSQKCEDTLIDETKTTPRAMPRDEQHKTGKCIVCDKETDTVIYYARTY